MPHSSPPLIFNVNGRSKMGISLSLTHTLSLTFALFLCPGQASLLVKASHALLAVFQEDVCVPSPTHHIDKHQQTQGQEHMQALKRTHTHT